MRIENLLNPGVISSGLRLRTEAAKAISAAEIYLQAAGKQQLTDFFADCAVKAGGTSSLPANQAVVTSGQVIPVTDGTVVLTVTDGVVSAVFTPTL